MCEDDGGSGGSSGGGGGGGTGGNGDDSGDQSYEEYDDKLLSKEFFIEYGHLFTQEEEAFIRDNPWLLPSLLQYIANDGEELNPDWPDLGFLGNFFRDIVFDTREEAIFFARYVNGDGDWHISEAMFKDIVADAEKNDAPQKNYDTPKGAYKKVFNLNGTSSKYVYGLGSFTIYYDSNDKPIGLYDEYDWNFQEAEFIDYVGDEKYLGGEYFDIVIQGAKTASGYTERGFFNEWATRGMRSVSHFLGEAKKYKIYYP